jgi:hypothetical protein
MMAFQRDDGVSEPCTQLSRWVAHACGLLLLVAIYSDFHHDGLHCPSHFVPSSQGVLAVPI